MTSLPDLKSWQKEFDKKFGDFGHVNDKFEGVPMPEEVKDFISSLLKSQQEQRDRESPVKYYYQVAQHLRKVARDKFIGPDDLAIGYYDAIKEIERYFQVEDQLSSLLKESSTCSRCGFNYDGVLKLHECTGTIKEDLDLLEEKESKV